MKPDQRFLKQPKNFWANVRSLSQELGYTVRGAGEIKVFSIPEIVGGLRALNLSIAHVVDAAGKPTEFGVLLRDYFTHRAGVLNSFVRPRLMDKERAAKEFQTLLRQAETALSNPDEQTEGRQEGRSLPDGDH